MESNFEVLEMQKWNLPANRVQSIDEKNGVICLFIMFTARAAVNKMSDLSHFLYSLNMLW